MSGLASTAPTHTEGGDDAKPWGALRPRGLTAAILGICHALPATPRFYYSLIRALRGPVKRGPVRSLDVRVLDLELRLRTRGNFCETTALFAPQFYDVEELGWLCERLADGGWFVDVGGNVGLYSLTIAHRLRGKVHVLSVEPDPDLASRMAFNARHNGLSIVPAAVALSDYVGDGTLAIDERQRGQNSLAQRDDPASAKRATSVPVTTLHALCVTHGIAAIRALKIDVEGHEDRILRHFFSHAPQALWPEAIVIEHVHDAAGSVAWMVDRLGYRQAGSTPRNALLLRG